ncbi:MAG: response regulator transcription factor [Chloroflexi bacterium]|nr:MAG: response regulator transcription factor [Chloroflexota bacterium]
MELSVLSLPAYMAKEKQHTSSARRVLIVEEHPSIVNLLYWALKLEGYEAIATPGKDWIDQTIVSGNDFLAILLDLSREAWSNRDTPLVVLTTTPNTDRHIDGYPIIRKPFHIHELLSKVESFTSQSR